MLSANAQGDSKLINKLDNKYTNIFQQRYPSEFISVGVSYRDGFYRVSVNIDNYKYGLCDKNGKELFFPEYEKIDCNGNLISVKKNGKTAIYGTDKQLLLDYKYDNIKYLHQFDDGYCEVELDGKLGLIDKNFKEVIPPSDYKDISGHQLNEYGENCEVTKINEVRNYNNTGVYNVKLQKEIIPCNYSSISIYMIRDGKRYINVTKDYGSKGMEGVWDLEEGKEIIPCLYNSIYTSMLEKSDYSNGNYCICISDGNYAIRDKNGNEIISHLDNYKYFRWDNNTLADKYLIVVKDCVIEKDKTTYLNKIAKNGKWGVVNLETKELIIPCLYNYISYAGEGLFLYNKDGIIDGTEAKGGRWGYLDNKGNIVVEAQYESAGEFKDGVAQVTKDGVTTMMPHPVRGTNLTLSGGGSASVVDVNIPQTTATNEETFAFVFANENYTHFSGADYSINDGKIFVEYCKKTLGIPATNVRYYEDATYGNMVGAMNKLQDIANVYDGDAKIIVYFSGLGFTDTTTKEQYLLPSDASVASLSSVGLSMKSLMNRLNSLNTKMTLLLIDAPFNGTDKTGKLLASSRGVQISSKTLVPNNNVVLCMGGNTGNNVYFDKKLRHGLFTYSLLEKLQSDKGILSVNDWLNSAKKRVEKLSISQFDKLQSPQIHISGQLINKLSILKF